MNRCGGPEHPNPTLDRAPESTNSCVKRGMEVRKGVVNRMNKRVCKALWSPRSKEKYRPLPDPGRPKGPNLSIAQRKPPPVPLIALIRATEALCWAAVGFAPFPSVGGFHGAPDPRERPRGVVIVHFPMERPSRGPRAYQNAQIRRWILRSTRCLQRV